MTNKPFSKVWNHRSLRRLFIVGIALTAANSASAYFFNSRYTGGPLGLILMAGVAIPHGALMLAVVVSQRESAMWIRLNAWFVSNLILFLPQVVWIGSFFPGWIWQYVDVTTRPSDVNAFIETVATSLSLLAVACFPLWPIAEIAANWTNLTLPKSPSADSRERSEHHGLTTAAYCFVAIQALMGLAMLVFAMGFSPNLDRIPAWNYSRSIRPFFTISFTHFLIAYAVLSRTRLGWIAFAFNLIAWGTFLFVAFFLNHLLQG